MGRGLIRRRGRRASTALLALLLGLGAVARPAVADRGAATQALVRARALQDGGDLCAAGPAYSEAARLAREARWPEVEQEALRGVLTCAFACGDLVGARDASVQLVAFHERREEPLSATRARVNLGYLETSLGRPRRALEHLDRAIAFAREQGPRGLLAAALTRSANARTLMRDPVRALAEVEEAIRLYGSYEEAEKPAHLERDLFDALIVLGNLHLDLGDSERARQCYEQALEAVGDGSPDTANVVALNVAISWYVGGQPGKARDLLLSAAERLRSEGVAEMLVVALTQLGYVQGLLGHDEQALEAFDEAARLDATNPVPLAYARLYAADALARLGRTQEAREAYRAARDEGKALFDRQLQADAWRGLADVALATGATKEALVAARASLGLVNEITAGLAPVSGALGRDLRRACYETATRAGFASQNATVAFEMLERGRAAVLLERVGGYAALVVPNLPSELVASEAQARERLLAAQIAYDGACRTGRIADLGEAGPRLEAERLAHEAVLDRIQRHATASRRHALASIGGPQSVRACLAADEVLILYAVAAGTVHAVVLTSHDARMESLCALAAIASEVRDLRTQEKDEAAIRALAGSLRTKLLDPLELPADATRLLISPGGVLGGLPFGLLDDERTVSLVPSGTVLRLLREERGPRGQGLLALGDPDYGPDRDGRAVLVYWHGRSLDRLLRSRDEVLGIPGPDVERLLGPGATEDALVQALTQRGRWRGVHLACHGLVNEARPAHTALALSPGEGSDGFLSVQEIFGLRIATDLAVLSACETSLGSELAGNGTVGLTQAFLYAGARRVIASSWNVDDEATQFLMGRFYAYWRAQDESVRLGPAEALKRAQAETRGEARWSHPRYWAGWALWGLPEKDPVD